MVTPPPGGQGKGHPTHPTPRDALEDGLRQQPGSLSKSLLSAASPADSGVTAQYHTWYILKMTPPGNSGKSIVARFYRLPGGREPVRDWLGEQTPEDRRRIGGDLMKVEFGWPCGAPLCRSLSGYTGLYEVRSRLKSRRIARVFFTVSEQHMVLLHGFIKKTQATPLQELKLAERRMKEYIRYA